MSYNAGLQPTTSEDRLMAMLSYLLAFVVGFLAPLIIYFVKKGQSKFVEFHALQCLFLQLALVVVSFALAIFVPIAIGVGAAAGAGAGSPAAGAAGMGIGMLLFFLLAMAVGLGSLILMIMYAIKANNGEWAEMPFVGPIAARTVGLHP